MLQIISLGAGVQSTTMALMAAHGEITPMPDCAIFADTGWEPQKVYQHLCWLTTALPFQVHRVSVGNLRDDIIQHRHPTAKDYEAVPWFFQSPGGEDGMGRRQCTKEYKLTPIRRKVRELLGNKTPKGGAQMWIGITTDEKFRVKPSWLRYMENRWPLIEMGMHRNDCLKWIERNNYPSPPKSSCIGCPFHSDMQWRELRDGSPNEWQDAVAIDKIIRNQSRRGSQFMHRSLKPLDQVDLSTAEDRGQLNLFNNECEGMCGV